MRLHPGVVFLLRYSSLCTPFALGYSFNTAFQGFYFRAFLVWDFSAIWDTASKRDSEDTIYFHATTFEYHFLIVILFDGLYLHCVSCFKTFFLALLFHGAVVILPWGQLFSYSSEGWG